MQAQLQKPQANEQDLTKQILQNIHEVNSKTETTLLTLNQQGQQLNRIQTDMQTNQNKLHKMEYIQGVMKSKWGQFKAIFSSPKQEKFDNNGQVAEQQKQKTQTQTTGSVGASNQSAQGQQDIFDEIVQQVDILKNNQLLMKQVINDQNAQLDKINNIADKQTNQMQKINAQSKRMIK